MVKMITLILTGLSICGLLATKEYFSVSKLSYVFLGMGVVTGVSAVLFDSSMFLPTIAPRVHCEVHPGHYVVSCSSFLCTVIQILGRGTLRLREYCTVWSAFEAFSASLEYLVEIRRAVGGLAGHCDTESSGMIVC